MILPIACLVVAAVDPALTSSTSSSLERPAWRDRMTERADTSEADGRVPLGLDRVLAAADRAHPKVLGAFAGRDEKTSKRLSRQGAFDLRLVGKAGTTPFGEFDRPHGDVWLEQPTPWWGMEFYGGYRNGADFPIYDAKSETSEAGEIRAGMRLPLAKGGPIDGRRRDLAQAGTDVDDASYEILRTRLEIAAKAASSYWKWVAAGQDREVSRALLALALERDAAVKAQVERGAVPALAAVDNQRLILSRRAKLVASERKLQAAAYALSLFLRDEEGDPRVPDSRELPVSMPRADVGAARFDPEALVAEALTRRPELGRLRVARERLQWDVRYADNSALPKVDVLLEVAADFGDKRPYGPDPDLVTKNAAEVGARLELAWPVQRREARGKAAAARAAIRKVDEALRLTRDAIAAEVRDALSEIAAAGERAELAEAAYDAAHRLEEGERRKLELGQSDLLLVQIRESASAEAAREAIAAWADYHAARAWLSAATVGLGPVARELDQETERRRLSETPPAADGGAAPR